MFKDGEMQVGSWIKMKGIRAWRGGVEIMEEISPSLRTVENTGKRVKMGKRKVPSSEEKDAEGQWRGVHY